MKHLPHMTTLVAALCAATTLAAQTIHEQKSNSRWSLQVEAGGGVFHGLTSSPSMSMRQVVPTLHLGTTYALDNGVHFGTEVGYLRLKWNDTGILDHTVTTPNYEVHGHLTTLTTRAARMDNRHNAHLYQVKVHANYDLMHRWPVRRLPQFHLWVGIGLGYIHAKAQETGIWAYKEDAISQTDQNLTIYSHAYVEHKSLNSYWNMLSMSVPIRVAYDICPHTSIYLKAEYQLITTGDIELPIGLFTTAIGWQFHF